MLQSDGWLNSVLNCVTRPILRKLNRVDIEYVETQEFFSPVMAPFVEKLIVAFGAQLKVLDITFNRFVKAIDDAPTPHISKTVLQRLQSPQHLSIHFTGFSTGNNALEAATEYIESFLDSLPLPSLVASLSLRIDEHSQAKPEMDEFSTLHTNMLGCIATQLAFPNKWPRLNSVFTMVDMQDEFSEPTEVTKIINQGAETPKIMSLLRVNYTGYLKRVFPPMY